MCWYYAERFCSFSLPLSLPQSNSRLSHNALRHASKNHIHFGSSEASFFPFPISRYHTFNYSSGRNSCAQCASNLMKNKSKWERKWQTNKNPPKPQCMERHSLVFIPHETGFLMETRALICAHVFVCLIPSILRICALHTHISTKWEEREREEPVQLYFDKSLFLILLLFSLTKIFLARLRL